MISGLFLNSNSFLEALAKAKVFISAKVRRPALLKGIVSATLVATRRHFGPMTMLPSP